MIAAGVREGATPVHAQGGRRLVGLGRVAYPGTMTVSFEELEKEVARLSPADKARLLQAIAPGIVQTWSGIESTPGVMGGDACLVRTRIPVWLLENYRRLGWSEARILENFPTLRAADLAIAWAYVDSHRDKIDEAIRDQDAA
jgi:uncharacterized protein (DUF433 family)